MANIRGANLPNYHKQSNCQTAQLRLQTALRQDLFTFLVRVPPTQNLQPHISRLQAKSNGRTRLLARQRTDGSNIPPSELAPFKQPPAADKRCVSTSVSVRLLLPRVGLEQSTLRFFIIGRALHICKSQTSTKVKSKLQCPTMQCGLAEDS